MSKRKGYHKSSNNKKIYSTPYLPHKKIKISNKHLITESQVARKTRHG